MQSESDPPRGEGLPPGYDEADPYENADLREYPDWWKRNVELFRNHQMRPYRPPRFKDGELTSTVITELEDELGVTVQLRAIDPHEGKSWQLWVDGRPVTEIDHAREGDGYTEYKIDSERFVELVRAAPEQSDSPD